MMLGVVVVLSTGKFTHCLRWSRYVITLSTVQTRLRPQKQTNSASCTTKRLPTSLTTDSTGVLQYTAGKTGFIGQVNRVYWAGKTGFIGHA